MNFDLAHIACELDPSSSCPCYGGTCLPLYTLTIEGEVGRFGLWGVGVVGKPTTPQHQHPTPQNPKTHKIRANVSVVV